MPRRGRISKKAARPDAVFSSVTVQRFINKMTRRGKRSKAEKVFYLAMNEVKKKLNKEPLEVFEKALANAAPLLEVKARRVGGATYQVPVEVSKERGAALAMQWLREGALERKAKSMVENLSGELIDAFNGVGAAIKNRENLHKTAEANKAFAHFRW